MQIHFRKSDKPFLLYCPVINTFRRILEFLFSLRGQNWLHRGNSNKALERLNLSRQSIRLNHRFVFSLQIPEECYNIHVPRLILQPLVENSVSHGIYDKLKDGKIVISAILRDSVLHIKITDNGLGIAEPWATTTALAA